ncbi:MAG: CaiB/BaiF CoA-transferase family protein [Acidimicrobiales bacterium]|nr:CaiB/BaiF CoA-transferase family protein [Acidimicrobiales bacterium]
MAGPLAGVRVIELAGLGALPFGTLKLADMGAEVVRVDRLAEVPAEKVPGPYSSWDRGRRSIAVDLKQPSGVETVLRLAEDADVFLEAFRPGVTERLGVGPDEVMARNPAIVYGRLTGWGQTGVLAPSAGHSLNYEAITGVIGSVGPAGGPPVPVMQLLGDFAGGGLTMAFGVMCALWEAKQSGRGQVVDAAMTDGVASLASVFYGMQASGMHTTDLGTNLFDGGSPFYTVYECADGGYMSIAPIEPHFYALMLETIGIDQRDLPPQYDRETWPEVKAVIQAKFLERTRDEWCELLEGTDCCAAPVLSFDEAREYAHHRDRGTFVGESHTEVVPVPILSRTPGEIRPSPAWVGADTDDVLTDWGFSESEISSLRSTGAVGG